MHLFGKRRGFARFRFKKVGLNPWKFSLQSFSSKLVFSEQIHFSDLVLPFAQNYMFQPKFRSNRFGSRPQFKGGFGRPARKAFGPGVYSKDARLKEQILSMIRASQQNQANLIEQPKEVFSATHTFYDFQLSPEVLKNVFEKGYEAPTPIQDQAILPIVEGKDLIGMANTGTGKTAAFLIPLVDKVFRNRQEKILIIVPTRELATQIFEEFRDFSKNMQIRAAVCIGGASMNRQIFDLKANANFVIATPGRLMDLVQGHYLNLSQFGTVVLDETDRMVDIGFIYEIKRIIAMLPQTRQSLFFSATVSGKVVDILRAFVKDPITVSVKTQETAVNIEQEIIPVVAGVKKIDLLHDLLVSKNMEKVLIFGRTKFGVQKLADELVKRGFKAGAIHGNKRQGQRQRTLDDFKQNRTKILLATDVASRGLDIDNVSHVINFDLPNSYDDYVHRIGRTGRANKKGVALTLVD